MTEAVQASLRSAATSMALILSADEEKKRAPETGLEDRRDT